MNLFTSFQDLKYRRLVIPMLVLISALAITTCSGGDDEDNDVPVQIVYTSSFRKARRGSSR